MEQSKLFKFFSPLPRKRQRGEENQNSEYRQNEVLTVESESGTCSIIEQEPPSSGNTSSSSRPEIVHSEVENDEDDPR